MAKWKKRDIVTEFDNYFGNVSKLANWQGLCRDLGIEEELRSINKCRNALRGVWVNIYDFLDARGEGEIPKRWRSEKDLAEYTWNSGKVFPKKIAKKGGPVRALLAHIL